MLCEWCATWEWDTAANDYNIKKLSLLDHIKFMTLCRDTYMYRYNYSVFICMVIQMVVLVMTLINKEYVQTSCTA